jgi:excisionase family DNA binding protein
MSKDVLSNLRDTHVCVREAVALLGVSRQRIVALCQRGRLPGAKLMYGRWLIPRASVIARKNKKTP